MGYDREIEEAIKGLHQDYIQDNNLDTLPAVTGDKDGNLIVPFLPDHWWVRIQTSNGLSQKIHVRAPTGKVIAARPGINVQLERDKKGRLRICEPDTDNTDASGGSVTVLQQQALTPRIAQDNLETLGVVPTSPPSLYVTVKSLYVVVSGIWYYFPGKMENLTSKIPAAGNMCYAVIFVKNDYLTTEVLTSTPRLLSDVPLDLTDIQECQNASSTGSTAVCAMKLTGSTTVFDEMYFKDKDNYKPLQRAINGEPSYINEYRIAAINVANGASAPTAALRAVGASGNLKVPVLQFSKITQQDVYFELHAPSDLINAYNIAFHAMVFPGAAWTAGNFMIKLEYLVKNETSGSTATGTPTTIQYDYTPGAATDIAELEFPDTIDLNTSQTLMCHVYRDVANDNGDDVLSIRFFEISYTARLT